MQSAGRVAGRRLLQHSAAASAARPGALPAIASTTSASGRRGRAALAHADGAFGLRRGWRAFHSGLVVRLAEIVMKVPG